MRTKRRPVTIEDAIFTLAHAIKPENSISCERLINRLEASIVNHIESEFRPILNKMSGLCSEIEREPASEQNTKCSVLASEIRIAMEKAITSPLIKERSK